MVLLLLLVLLPSSNFFFHARGRAPQSRRLLLMMLIRSTKIHTIDIIGTKRSAVTCVFSRRRLSHNLWGHTHTRCEEILFLLKNGEKVVLVFKTNAK